MPLLAGLPCATAPVAELDLLLFRLISKLRGRVIRDQNILDNASDARHGNYRPILKQGFDEERDGFLFRHAVRPREEVGMCMPLVPGKTESDIVIFALYDKAEKPIEADIFCSRIHPQLPLPVAS
jgi:hypothetical protein